MKRPIALYIDTAFSNTFAEDWVYYYTRKFILLTIAKSFHLDYSITRVVAYRPSKLASFGCILADHVSVSCTSDWFHCLYYYSCGLIDGFVSGNEWGKGRQHHHHIYSGIWLEFNLISKHLIRFGELSLFGDTSRRPATTNQRQAFFSPSRGLLPMWTDSRLALFAQTNGRNQPPPRTTTTPPPPPIPGPSRRTLLHHHHHHHHLKQYQLHNPNRPLFGLHPFGQLIHTQPLSSYASRPN